jgi:hypothetical protein
MMEQSYRFVATPEKGEVSALLLRPESPRSLLVLGHAASTGMTHPSMASLAQAVAARDAAVFRYQFPYMERGGGGMDAEAVRLATVRAAVATAAAALPGVPLFAGGRSMGGRMASMAQSESPLSGVRGLVFFAYPLHPAGRPGLDRAAHLAGVNVPLLFIQGDRDDLAELSLLRQAMGPLGERATLRLLAGADHSFHVRKSSERSDGEVLEEAAAAAAAWMIAVAAAERTG